MNRHFCVITVQRPVNYWTPPFPFSIELDLEDFGTIGAMYRYCLERAAAAAGWEGYEPDEDEPTTLHFSATPTPGPYGR